MELAGLEEGVREEEGEGEGASSHLFTPVIRSMAPRCQRIARPSPLYLYSPIPHFLAPVMRSMATKFSPRCQGMMTSAYRLLGAT